MPVTSCLAEAAPARAVPASRSEPHITPPVVGRASSERAYQPHLKARLVRGELRMAALGFEPAMIDEETAAAVCALPVKRFRALCPIQGQRVGTKVLRPLDLVKQWSVRYWAEATGFSLEGLGPDAEAAGSDDWASALPDSPTPKGGRHAVAH